MDSDQEKKIEHLINKIKARIEGQEVDVVIAALSFILVNVTINTGHDVNSVIQFLRATEENQKEYRRIQ